jgi:glycosyltransferase involved in cell wall biosynthesis
VEHQPRVLLKALAEGVPVICTTACGLHGWSGDPALLTIVPAGDLEALENAVKTQVTRG